MVLLAAVMAVAGAVVAHGMNHHDNRAPRAETGPVIGLVQQPSNRRFLPAWQFENFIAGRVPAPSFSSTVTLVVDGKTSVLTRTQAQQRTTWRGSPLDLYSVAKSYVLRDGGHDVPPTVQMFVDAGHDFVCGGEELPQRWRAVPSLWLGLVPSGPGVSPSCTFLNVFVRHGRIDALVARTSNRLTTSPTGSRSQDSGAGTR